VIRYGTGYKELCKNTGISDANNSSIKQTDLELHVKELQHPTKTNYDRFVVHATLGTCLPSFKVDDNAWNEIMAMAIRMHSSFLMIGTKRCTNVPVENWHGWR
jgi:hypothetical protein